MSQIKTLFKTQWLSLKQITLEKLGVEYIYVHSEPTDGQAVAVLGYRETQDGSLEFLIRDEIVPPWSLKHSSCALTGSYEGGDPVNTAQMELHEEAGYQMPVSEFEYLDTVRHSKASDTRIHMFSIDLTGVDPEGPPEGDGSVLEVLGAARWTSDVFESSDALLHSLYALFMNKT